MEKQELGYRYLALGMAAAVLFSLSACKAGEDPAPTSGDLDHAIQETEAPQPGETPGLPTQAPAEEAPVPTPEQTPATVPESTPAQPLSGSPIPESTAVEESWFADAVFLGDSRTDGLKLYSGIKSADFISYKGMSVFAMDEKKCIEVGGSKLTVLEALARKQYGKVYLMLGVNELGYPSTEQFETAYKDLVDRIREIQPDASIYLQTILPVNETVGKEKNMASYITNAKIMLYNEAIARVAEEEQVLLVNVAEQFLDESGSLPAEDSSDGVHLTRKGYEAWFAYLQTHTGSE